MVKKGSREKDRLELSLDTGVQMRQRVSCPAAGVGLSEQELGLEMGWCVHDPEVTAPTRTKKHLQICPVGFDSALVNFASTLVLSQLFQHLPPGTS